MSQVQKNEKENDQAGELGSRIERHKAKSSLPKRSKIHKNKKKKSKAKIKFPIIQFLSLFFILLPIGFYGLNTYFQDRPVRVTNSDQVVVNNNEEEVTETIPTTATADDLKDNKEKDSEKAVAEKEKEEAKAKAEEEEKRKQEEQAKKKDEEKAKAQQEAEEKAKAQQEAEERAKAQQIADEKAKKEAAEKKKAAEIQAAKPDKDEYKVVLHTVQSEETLFRISMNYYKSQEGIALIREWNGLKGNEISNGQVLKIPIKK
ncbi:Elastin-binding protein EbpS [Peribacillus sp. Bi96]|uniref:LysM peptidoglycan-binding domain-containing protein n=1 Tax=Peribacillus sp. Bi96 TaxID=2884273 RepID=UPI001E14848F|nr:LysM peptidoglycan-binding domain-containing protein [Peribacillus sp. Bi96]CAH0182616.1 Elastin-binding protein EbpS [Peribacillus sp. Bi96]